MRLPFTRMTCVIALALVLSACAGILGIRPTASHPFEHRAHVLKGVNCVECHAGISTAKAAGELHVPSTAQCKGCHAKPHDEHDCNGCHGESFVRGGAQLAKLHLKFEHGVHMLAVKGECVKCHGAIGEERPEALRPKMATCFGCHQHKDQWTVRDCDGCHKDLQGERTPPASHLVHDGDWIREHGARVASSADLCASCHTQSSCSKCHGVNVAGLPARLAFDDVRLEGLHRAGFRARHKEEARANPGLCTTCHSESSCTECHAKERVGPGTASRSPHPAGWLSPNRGGGQHGMQARIDPASCAGCHGGAGEQMCVSCHRVGGPGGSPHGHGFTSTKDKRQDVPCRLCHASGL